MENLKNHVGYNRLLKKWLFKMKLTLTIFLFCLTGAFASTYSQATRLDITMKNGNMVELIKQIESKSEFFFYYQKQELGELDNLTVKAKNATVMEILDKVLKGTPFDYSIIDRYIVVRKVGDDFGNDVLATAKENVATQQRAVSGKVTDEFGQPLPGATIVIKGTTQGTVTNANGEYSLVNLPSDATLVFSFVGMRTQEAFVGNQTMINIIMEEETIGIEEVVAVAYGTQKRQEITGAVSSVTSQSLENMQMQQLGQKLQGKLAGVRIYQSTGQPGTGMSFRIRGQASVNAGNQPLIVIDGFPSSTGMESINPDEIESVSVLKDASSASLYGSRAANGVILITTKLAKEGQKDITFSMYSGIQNVPQRGRPNVMNAREFAQFKNEWFSDKGMAVPERYQNPEIYGPDDGTDWYDILLNPNAPTQNYQLSISSGTARIKSSVSVNYNKQEGVVLNTFAERFSIRANNLFNVSDKLTFGFNVAPTYRNTHNLQTDGTWNILSAAFLMDPTLEYKNEDGTLPVGYSSPGMFGNPNWYRVLTERENPTQQLNLLLNGFGEYEITEGLSYKLRSDIDVGNSKNRYWSPSTSQGGMFRRPPNPATGSYSTSNYLNWQIENRIDYVKTINERHNFDTFIGYSAQMVKSESSSITGSQFPDDEIAWISAASVRLGNVGLSEWSLLSYFGRLNYNFDSKYLISLAIRRDGASKFGEDKKYSTFPSVSVGWITSNESFMSRNQDIVSFLKFRASYGKVGNYNIGNYTSISQIGTSNYVFDNSLEAGKRISNIGNSFLTWETTTQGDVGLDLGFFKDRIFLLYDYYWKTTNGLLYAVDIPYASGFGSIQSNIGEFDFWGHEFTVETKNFVNKFRWNTAFTISWDRNLVKKLGKEDRPLGGYQEDVDYVRTEVGHPIGLFYGYIHEGVFMNEEELAKGPWIEILGGSDVGSVRLKDISGPDGVPDGWVDPEHDKTFIGDPNPKFIFGITNQLSYKNFDLDIHMTGRWGGDIFNYELSWTENIDGVFNPRPEVKDRWRSVDNPGKGEFPRCNSNEMHRYNNTREIFDGSFLALKNISLGYTIPIFKEQVKNVKVYISSQNLFMLSNYPGMNPEGGRYGLNGLNEGRDETQYPIARTFTIGANINF